MSQLGDLVEHFLFGGSIDGRPDSPSLGVVTQGHLPAPGAVFALVDPAFAPPAGRSSAVVVAMGTRLSRHSTTPKELQRLAQGLGLSSDTASQRLLQQFATQVSDIFRAKTASVRLHC